MTFYPLSKLDVPLVNKHMHWNDLQDIKQLEGLIRAHVCLAQMVGTSSPDYVSHALKAYYSVIRLIFQAVENAIFAMKDISKIATALEASTALDKKKSVLGDMSKKPATNTAGGAASKNKPKVETGASGYLPQTLDQWSVFEMSEEITVAWCNELMNKIGINPTTIVEPYLLFYYLDKLGGMLAEQGYTHLLFPVYNLQLILINCVLKYEFESIAQSKLVSMNSYIRLKLINLCVELNLTSAVAFHQQLLNDLIVTPDAAATATGAVAPPYNSSLLLKLLQIDPIEACYVREHIFERKQRMSQLQDEEAGMHSALSCSNAATSKGDSPLKLRKRALNRTAKILIKENANKTNQLEQASVHDLQLPGENRPIHEELHDILYQDMWIQLAETLVENGFFQTARDFLFESLNATNVSSFLLCCQVYNDNDIMLAYKF